MKIKTPEGYVIEFWLELSPWHEAKTETEEVDGFYVTTITQPARLNWKPVFPSDDKPRGKG